MREAWNPLEGERPELSIPLGTNSDEQISIVVVHKDRPEYLSICLQSIAVTSFNYNYEIIVVDNGSTNQDSHDFLETIADEVKIVRNDKNLYWSAGANKGVQAANKNSKYIVFLHCDVVITNPSWLDLLMSVGEAHKSGMIGVEMQHYQLQQKRVDFIREWLVMFTRECWESCGPWPENLPMIGHSFILTMKAQNAGFKPQMLKNSIAHHYKIFSLDVNTFERMTESAMVAIPQQLRAFQSESVRGL